MDSHRCEPEKCMLSPLAGLMNLHTSSTPSVVSQPCLRPRWTAKQSAVSSSGPRNWCPHSCAKIHSFTDGRNLGDQLRVEDQEPGIGRAIIVELTVEHCRPLPARHLAPVEPQLARRYDLGFPADVGSSTPRASARPMAEPVTSSPAQRQAKSTTWSGVRDPVSNSVSPLRLPYGRSPHLARDRPARSMRHVVPLRECGKARRPGHGSALA